MKKFIIFSLLVSSLFGNGLVDFGIVGTTYNIAEENGDDVIQEGLKRLDTDAITKQLTQDVLSSFTSHHYMPESNKAISTKSEDFVIAQHDIVSPDGILVYSAGDKIPSNLPIGQTFSICFINGNDKPKVIEWVLKEFGKCIYLVNEVDSRGFSQKYSIEAYPIAEQNIPLVDRYNVATYPTKITRYENIKETKTLNIIKFKEELELHEK